MKFPSVTESPAEPALRLGPKPASPEARTRRALGVSLLLHGLLLSLLVPAA
jgi:hypothetical protein